MGDMIKKYMPAIILLFIIIIIWAGLIFFFDTKKTSSNIDVEIYRSPLQSGFDNEVLDETYEGIVKTLPVSPKEFINLKKKD